MLKIGEWFKVLSEDVATFNQIVSVNEVCFEEIRKM